MKPSILAALLAAALLSASCAPQTCWKGGVPMRETETTCDGFHPDYALVWSKDGRQRVLQVCHGCHEWKFFGPGGMVYTDIEDDTYFMKLLPLLPLLPKDRID